MTATLRVPRRRGGVSGALLVLLGIWGALIPFVGPYFSYAYTPDTSWSYTSGRLWLEILPGVAAIVGGAIVLLSGHRAVGIFGAWLAAVGGAWFVVGGVFSVLWTSGLAAGTPVGGKVSVLVEQIGYFAGLGVVIVFFAALALGRFTVISTADAQLAGSKTAAAEPERETAETTSGSGLFGKLRSR